MTQAIAVHVAYDEEAHVWYVSQSDAHGLRVEADTIDAMIPRVRDALADLLEDAEGAHEVAVDVIAHHPTRVLLQA